MTSVILCILGVQVCRVIRTYAMSLSSAVYDMEHHHYLTSSKLYCLATETHVCEQLAQNRYAKVEWLSVELVTC